jgi:tetratricopeptide (TPR) repeat protein
VLPFITDQTRELEALVSQGNIGNAIDRIEDIISGLSTEEAKKTKLLHLKAYLIRLNDSSKNTLPLIDELLSYAYNLKNSALISETLLLKAEAYRAMGNFTGAEAIRHPSVYTEILPEYLPEYIRLVQLCEEEMRSIEPTNNSEEIFRQALLLKCKGIILITEKEIEQAFSILNNSLDLFRGINNLEGIAGVLKVLGSAYGIRGQIDTEIQFLEDSLGIHRSLNLTKELAGITLRLGVLHSTYLSKPKKGLELILHSFNLSEALDDQQGVAVALNFIGNLYTWRGELDRGLKFLQRSMFSSEKHGNTENLAFTLNNIGWNHHIRGELQLAMQSLDQSFSISREKQYPWVLIWTLSNIGYVYQAKSDFDTACGYYTQSINISDEINDYLACSWSLYHIIKLNLDQDSLESTKDHIMRLQDTSNRYRINLMSQMYRVSRGMLLNRSSRLKDKARAQEYLEQVASEKVHALEVTSDAIINLCEILLFEYKISEDTAVLKELEDLSDRLLQIAEDQHSHSLLSEGYLLKSEIALLLDDSSLAKQLIDKAQRIAEEKGLQRLALAISREYDSILDQIGVIDFQAPQIQEQKGELEIEKVENLLGRMTTRNIAAVSNAIPEEPEMLLIISEGGLTVFTYNFKPDDLIKSQLVGGFLSAIESFSNEIFSSSIERVSLGDYRLILHSHLLLTFAYVFKGESYSAVKKVKSFVSSIESQTKIWKSIRGIVDTGKLLSKEDEAVLVEIIEDIFPVKET